MLDKKISTIGILGGMGPEATLLFYKKILNYTSAKKDQDHIPTLIYSNPQIPDRTQAIFSKQDDLIILQLQQSAQILEQGGASFIVIPCNAAHYWIDEIRAAVQIPAIDMLDETIYYLVKSGVKKVGLLATEGTIKANIYQRKSSDKLEIIVPPESLCKDVMTTIHEIKEGSKSEKLHEPINQAREWFLTQGIHKIILGCTELPLLFEGKNGIDWTIDPMDILAKKTVERATAFS